MDEQIKKITLGFFKSLKCEILEKSGIYVVSNIPKSFEDLYGKVGPYSLSFDSAREGSEYVIRGSSLVLAINKYLEGAGKTSLVKIDFKIDPSLEVAESLNFKNCEIGKTVRKDLYRFFTRFTFLTTFRYLNESEQVLNEIYVHEGKVVSGDLSGYEVVEGEINSVRELGVSVDMEKDYSVARDNLRELLKEKTSSIGGEISLLLEKEIDRIKIHYESLIGELGGDINLQLKKIKETELQLRVSEGEQESLLRNKLDRLRKGLLKVGDDESKNRILKEQEFTIKDAHHKHSLNIDNKLINTTVIYYPVYSFNLFLNGDSSRRSIEMVYDPLTKTFGDILCDSCSKKITNLNLCSSGHVCCDECVMRCDDCGKLICEKCLKKSCSVCGKILCHDCALVCLGCGKAVCSTHLRKDCVTGEDRCVNCLRACLRCHGLSDPKYFGEAKDGSKVCQKCLGEERRNNVMKEIFRD